MYVCTARESDKGKGAGGSDILLVCTYVGESDTRRVQASYILLVVVCRRERRREGAGEANLTCMYVCTVRERSYMLLVCTCVRRARATRGGALAGCILLVCTSVCRRERHVEGAGECHLTCMHGT